MNRRHANTYLLLKSFIFIAQILHVRQHRRVLRLLLAAEFPSGLPILLQPKNVTVTFRGKMNSPFGRSDDCLPSFAAEFGTLGVVASLLAAFLGLGLFEGNLFGRLSPLLLGGLLVGCGCGTLTEESN